MTVLHKTRDGNEIWAESHLVAPNLERMAVVIWTVDPATDTLIAGRYYSEPVQREAADIETFMKSINER